MSVLAASRHRYPLRRHINVAVRQNAKAHSQYLGRRVLIFQQLDIVIISFDHRQRQTETFEPLEPVLQRDVDRHRYCSGDSGSRD